MIDSMSNIQSTSCSFSSSDDLTSLSSISSEFASLEPISSIQSTISSCNKSLPDEVTSFNYLNSDSETLTSPSCLINRELSKRFAMNSSESNESDTKSDSEDTINDDLSDLSDSSDDDNSSQCGKVKEIYEHTIVHKNMDEAQLKKYLNNFEHLEDSEDEESSMESTLKSNVSIETSDNSSISVTDVDPASIKQFKHMIEKQKNYLDSLQKELNRLHKMEQVLSKLHQKSKMQKKMLKAIEICDKCEGICNSTCKMSTVPMKIPDQVNVQTKVRNNHQPVVTESSNENEVEEDYCANFKSSRKVKSDATTQTSSSKCKSPCIQTKQLSLPTRKERFEQIHDKVDEIIHKLHEATLMDTEKPKESIESQPLDHSIEVHNAISSTSTEKPSSNDIKSACDVKPTTSVHESKKQPFFWTIPVIEQKLDEPPRSDKINTHRKSSYCQTEDFTDKKCNLSLQEAFRERCGTVLRNSESRVNEIKMRSGIRKETAYCRLENHLDDLMYRKDQDVIQGYGPSKVKVIKPRKMFTEREMRKQTERLYSHLPEIKKLKEDKMKQQNGKTYRLMAKIFSQRLKSNAVHGKVTFPLTERLTKI